MPPAIAFGAKESSFVGERKCFDRSPSAIDGLVEVRALLGVRGQPTFADATERRQRTDSSNPWIRSESHDSGRNVSVCKLLCYPKSSGWTHLFSCQKRHGSVGKGLDKAALGQERPFLLSKSDSAAASGKTICKLDAVLTTALASSSGALAAGWKAKPMRPTVTRPVV